jgi:hypothetical protein
MSRGGHTQRVVSAADMSTRGVPGPGTDTIVDCPIVQLSTMTTSII